MSAVRVLFVCTGNICRSPTAEALLRHHAGGLPILADSCGVSAEEQGNPPHPMTLAEAERRGVAMPTGARGGSPAATSPKAISWCR